MKVFGVSIATLFIDSNGDEPAQVLQAFLSTKFYRVEQSNAARISRFVAVIRAPTSALSNTAQLSHGGTRVTQINSCAAGALASRTGNSEPNPNRNQNG